MGISSIFQFLIIDTGLVKFLSCKITFSNKLTINIMGEAYVKNNK